MTLDYIIEICVAIDIAILGIAYPIIVDKISNIGDKYSSEYLSILFNNEFPQKVIRFKIKKREYSFSIFKSTLYLTIVTFLFLIFSAPPLFNWNNWFINNSSKLIVLFFSTLLTIFFFKWLDIVVLYNGKSTALLKKIVLSYEGLNDNAEMKSYHLKAINEFTFYAIEKQDEHLQTTLLEFYAQIFFKIRRSHNKSIPLIYPIDLYFLVNKLNSELINSHNKKLLAIEHRAVSGVWLLGEDFEHIIISEETYNWLWQNIYLICDKSKFVKMYWANVSQYFDYKLERVSPDYIFGQPELIIRNAEEVNKRKNERREFLEFHYALGGLMFYRNQYSTLKYFFEFTQSQPPRYPLLPDSMTEVFYWFEHFRNEFSDIRKPIEYKYPFPELDSYGNQNQIRYWICCYIALLFIRQYTLHRYLITQNFTSLPELPNDVIELGNWRDTAFYFERCLKNVIKNETALSDTTLLETAKKNESVFLKFIDDLKESIDNKISSQKLNASLSDDKVHAFEKSTNEIITNAFMQYEKVFITDKKKSFEGELKLSVNGTRTLMSKSAFTDGDIPNLNYDSIIAETIARNNIQSQLPNSFIVSRTRRFLLDKTNLINGFERLITTTQQAIIIGINTDYEINEIITQSNFKSIYKIIHSTTNGIDNLIYVLKESDLPYLEHKNLRKDEVEKYKLKLINESLMLYSSVIDINQAENDSIKNEWSSEIDREKTDLKVQVSIAFLSIIHWKKDRDVVQINIASQFKEQGIQNDLNEIEPLK